MENVPLLTTADLTLAATLLAMGFDVLGIDMSNPKRQLFHFQKTLEIDSVIENYWNKKIVLSPIDVANSRRELITRIKSNEGH